MSLFVPILISAVLLAGCIGLIFSYWEKLFADPANAWRTFMEWSIKGISVPLITWLAFCSGIVPTFPPLWPAISPTASLSHRLGALGPPVLVGAFIIGSYWSAASLAWIAAIIGMRTRNRSDFVGFMIGGSVVTFPVAGVLVYFGGLPQAGLALSIWLLSIVHFTICDGMPRKDRPMYSRAIARLKFGKYNDAELEVLRQLEKYEDDFDGWMMLAELYARHFNQLAEADKTVRDLCAQPNLTAAQISLALNRLADWHLAVGNDPDAACAALAELCRKTRGSHFAEMAKVRISQLPATRQELVEQREKKPIRMPPLGDGFSQSKRPALAPLSKRDALRLTNDYVDKLKRDPNDVLPREKLASVLAESLNKPELGIEQLQLLIDMPDQPEKKMAEWLSLMASWKFKYCDDQQSAKLILQRIIRDYPQTPEAFAAQRWLKLMEFDWQFEKR